MFSRVRLVLGWAAAAAVLCGSPTGSAQQTVTYEQLVKRLLDLEQLAVLPATGETCAQWSSWDRSSRYDPATGKYLNWDANDDGPQYIREEGDQIVIAEMQGPGCIWRIWSALAQGGHVKIYLDGGDQPAVDLPFEKYFSGDTAPFAYPQLSYDLADAGCRGQNLYFPIPYQKSCKVVADRGWGRYYQFTYTNYPAGTSLPTFSAELAGQHGPQLQRVNDFFASSLSQDPAEPREGSQVQSGTAQLAPGESGSLELTGPRAITALRARLRLGDREEQMAALRELILKITWDGQPQAAVWCPLGDFFGTAPGVNLYRSLMTGMKSAGEGAGEGAADCYAIWYMPFARSAKLELVNEGPVARTLDFEITHAPLSRPQDGLGYFHCKWHRDTFRLPQDRWPDWSLLSTSGRGRFCGVMLHVWNPRGGWWGEGDEKFFVDGEVFPSTFGTGSEDYFGYAWCHPGLFERPFHAQTMTQDNRGHQSVLRWQVADNVPFQTSFEGFIEKYYRTEERGTEYAAVVCWYLGAGGTDPYEPVPVEQRHGYYVDPPLVAGGYQILNHPEGDVQTQGMGHFRGGQWTNDDHLWWTGAKPNSRLEIGVPVKRSGRYALSVILTKARDYAVVRLSLNDRPAGEAIDLYNPEVVNTEPIPLGEFDLREGQAKLTVEIVGANPQAVPSHMFGLDEILLQPVER